jgi:hypothetical protein
LTGGLGAIIAKRSVSLSKTYPILGIFLAFLGVVISSSSLVIGNLAKTAIPANAPGTGSLDLTTALPFVSVAVQAFATITFATPVLLLYVYDKNNGTLEYFLSLGMSQGDIYRHYLKAALMLASVLVGLDVVIDLVSGLILGMSGLLLLEVLALVVAMALPAVSFGTLVMMSFSSLQKQRVGSNQPLGMAIGIFTILPAYITSFAAPSLAFRVDLLVAGIVVGLSLLMYSLSSRLIRREKLLP